MMRFAVVLPLVVVTPLACLEIPDYVPRGDTVCQVGCPSMWLWVGPHDEAPSCPEGHRPLWDAWSAEALVPQECGACECGPAACVLPPAVTAHAPLCPGTDDPRVIEVGASWDGTCTARAPAISADAFASVTYAPPALAPCTPSKAPEPSPVIAAFARTCAAKFGDDVPAGFLVCLPPYDNGSCPPGLEKRIELTEEHIDKRTCTPCACGAPEGGTCVADVFLYGDSTCSAQIDAALTVDQKDTPCHDISSPLPLVAMRAEMTEAEPGSCTPSVSTVIGTVEQGAAYPLCCVP
jgi:hypothetical protein